MSPLLTISFLTLVFTVFLALLGAFVVSLVMTVAWVVAGVYYRFFRKQ